MAAEHTTSECSGLDMENQPQPKADSEQTPSEHSKARDADPDKGGKRKRKWNERKYVGYTSSTPPMEA